MPGSAATATLDGDDEALMASYAHGDGNAFDDLYRRFGPRLRAFFMRSFGQPALADDLVQQTFLRVHRARESFRGDSSLAAWLFTIAGNVRTDELRRRQRQVPLADGELGAADHVAGDTRSGEAARADADVAQAVRTALAALPETQRVVIHMHRFEGLSFAEIAARLGTREGAVRVRAFRGYERLRVSLRALAEEG